MVLTSVVARSIRVGVRDAMWHRVPACGTGYKLEVLEACGTESVIRFRRLAFGARFPAAMHPPILPRIGAHDLLEGRGVALGDVAERIVLRLPIGWIDDVL